MDPYRDMILRLFNQLRNGLAGGKLSGFPIATRMAEVKWSDELEYLAKMNVKTCRHLYDKCRSTNLFPYAGQNIGFSSYSGPEETYAEDELIKERVEDWFSEEQYTSLDIIQSYPIMSPDP